MPRKKIEKSAIAIYYPEDTWERAIQDAAKNETGNWLASHPCQLLSKAVLSIKCSTEWLDDDKLLPIRAHYLFAPHMTGNKDTVVFVTHLLYLRDLLENREINSTLHDPISFMTVPLAHFLFRDCYVHIHINKSLLRSSNAKATFEDIGGFIISEGKDLKIADNMISDIKYYGDDQKKQYVEGLIRDVQNRSGLTFQKAASHEIDFDVFSIGEHFPDILPDDVVWDKQLRINANVSEIQPGETGLVYIEYEDKKIESFPRLEFDKRFVLV